MEASEGEPKSADLAGKVRNWLNKTGLPLELEAVTAFRQAGFHCTHSQLYEDPETKKGREIDFLAHVRHELGLVAVCFVGECKATKNPWVVLREQGDEPSYLTAPHLGAAHEEMAKKLNWQDFIASDAGAILYTLERGGYALRQAFSADVDNAFAASIGVLKAANAVSNNSFFRPPRMVFAMPVLVVDSPIFECWIDGTGEVQLQQVQFSQYHFSAHIPDERHSVIRIVHRSQLEGFAGLCSDVAEGLLQLGQAYAERWMEQVRRAADF